MRYVALMIWSNGWGQKVAQLVEEDEGRVRYFSSKAEIEAAINPSFPADVICINLDTLEAEEL